MARLLKRQKLTDKQREVYEFMRDFDAANGRPPKTKEIIAGTSLVHVGQITNAKRALSVKGYITITGYGKYEVEHYER